MGNVGLVRVLIAPPLTWGMFSSYWAFIRIHMSLDPNSCDRNYEFRPLHTSNRDIQYTRTHTDCSPVLPRGPQGVTDPCGVKTTLGFS